jgi:hypothetical protein
LYLGCLVVTLLVLDLSNKTLFLLVKFYVGNHLLLLEILTSLLQTSYDTMLFQTRFLQFGIISHHSLQINLEIIQIIVGLLIELGEFNILLLQVLCLPSSLFCLFQLIGHVLIFMLDHIQLSFDCHPSFVMVFQSLLHWFLALGYRFADSCGFRTGFL